MNIKKLMNRSGLSLLLFLIQAVVVNDLHQLSSRNAKRFYFNITPNGEGWRMEWRLTFGNPMGMLKLELGGIRLWGQTSEEISAQAD